MEMEEGHGDHQGASVHEIHAAAPMSPDAPVRRGVYRERLLAAVLDPFRRSPRGGVIPEERTLKGLLLEYERQVILAALDAVGWNQSRVAATLRLLPSTLSEKMKRLGLRRSKHRGFAGGPALPRGEDRDSSEARRAIWRDLARGPQEVFAPCPACGGEAPQIEGPTHRYMESSPGCWRVYGEVLSRQYSDRRFRAVLQLTVDSYAAQHPGRPSPQAIQSVGLHLVNLCLVLERGLAPGSATQAIQAAARTKSRLFWLIPPPSLGALTIVDVAAAPTPEAHNQMVRAWAESVWAAWSVHHEAVRGWCLASGGHTPSD